MNFDGGEIYGPGSREAVRGPPEKHERDRRERPSVKKLSIVSVVMFAVIVITLGARPRI